MSEVITMGEPMAMFVADEEGSLESVCHYTRFLAGAEVNVSIGLSRLGYDVAYVTRVGLDPFGAYIQKALQDDRIRTSYLSVDPLYPTGFQLKSKVLMGDPEVVYFRKGSAASHLTSTDVEKVDLTKTRHIHVTGIPLALSDSCRGAIESLIERGRELNIPITFDPNLRPGLWQNQETMVKTINHIATLCDYFLPGKEEAAITSGYSDVVKASEFYLRLGVKAVIIKDGPNGAFVHTGTHSFTVPGFPVLRVIDTVGAGDGFAVGFISGILDGISLHETVKRANAIGALQVMTRGDNDGLPTRSELEAFFDDYLKLNGDK
ncbi:MAG: sugar kinase [Acidibacillus sp.]|nr:sugar kinase [Acidibacillus sp.]